MSRVLVEVTNEAAIFNIQEFGFQGSPDRFRSIIVSHDKTDLPDETYWRDYIAKYPPDDSYSVWGSKFWIPERSQWIASWKSKAISKANFYGCEEWLYGPFSIPQSSPPEEADRVHEMGSL